MREREKERNGWSTFQPQNKKGKVILFKFTGDESKTFQVTGDILIDTFLNTIFTLFLFSYLLPISIWYSITGAGRNTNKSIRIWAGKNKNRIDCIIINLNIKEFDDGMNININTNNINRNQNQLGDMGKNGAKNYWKSTNLLSNTLYRVDGEQTGSKVPPRAAHLSDKLCSDQIYTEKVFPLFFICETIFSVHLVNEACIMHFYALLYFL